MQGYIDPDVQQEKALGLNDPRAFLWMLFDPLIPLREGVDGFIGLSELAV